MTVIAMYALSAEKHPNADSLYVYKFAAPNQKVLQIVANEENIYEVNDVALIAQPGSVLLDDEHTKIKSCKIRGIKSFGMALGHAPDRTEPGADFSKEYCEPEIRVGDKLDKAKHIKWPSIESFYNVRKYLRAYSDEVEGKVVLPVVHYKAKVKLHGTNAAIQLFPDGRVVAQSRSSVLVGGNDNAGFAAWVLKNKSAFEHIIDNVNCHITLFGEWCGNGIQKGTALNKLDRRVFAIFAAQLGVEDDGNATLVTSPEALEILVPSHPDIFVLPWYGDAITIDFANPNKIVEEINEIVLEVEREDPWVKDIFNESGIGEGLVYYPVTKNNSREEFEELVFKAKGQAHRVRIAKVAVEVDPEVAESIDAFIKMYVTEPRLEQAAAEICGGVDHLEMKHMGNFIKWMIADIRKESVDDLEAANLTWNQVKKQTSATIAQWYKSQ